MTSHKSLHLPYIDRSTLDVKNISHTFLYYFPRHRVTKIQFIYKSMIGLLSNLLQDRLIWIEICNLKLIKLCLLSNRVNKS